MRQGGGPDANNGATHLTERGPGSGQKQPGNPSTSREHSSTRGPETTLYVQYITRVGTYIISYRSILGFLYSTVYTVYTIIADHVASTSIIISYRSACRVGLLTLPGIVPCFGRPRSSPARAAPRTWRLTFSRSTTASHEMAVTRSATRPSA